MGNTKATIGQYETYGCRVWIFNEEDEQFAKEMEHAGHKVTRIYEEENAKS